MYEDIFPIPPVIFSHEKEKKKKKNRLSKRELYMFPLVATSMQSSRDIQLNNVLEK